MIPIFSLQWMFVNLSLCYDCCSILYQHARKGETPQVHSRTGCRWSGLSDYCTLHRKASLNFHRKTEGSLHLFISWTPSLARKYPEQHQMRTKLVVRWCTVFIMRRPRVPGFPPGIWALFCHSSSKYFLIFSNTMNYLCLPFVSFFFILFSGEFLFSPSPSKLCRAWGACCDSEALTGSVTPLPPPLLLIICFHYCEVFCLWKE